MTEEIAVTQVDRDAAADFIRWQRKATAEWKGPEGDEAWQFFHKDFSRGIRQGIWDEHEIVQAFAKHRLASQPPSASEDVQQVTNGQYEADDFSLLADSARRIASYTEGPARRNVYLAAKQELSSLSPKSDRERELEVLLSEAKDRFREIYEDIGEGVYFSASRIAETSAARIDASLSSGEKA